MGINFNQILEKHSIISDQLSLDDPLRIGKSYWERFYNQQKFEKLNNKLQQQVLSFFQERYHFADQKSFKKVWDKLGTKVWTPKDELTAGTLRSIDTKLKESLIYHGEGIHAPKNPSNYSTIKQLTQALLHGNPVTLDLIEKRTIKAILISTDVELLKQFRNELQIEIENLSQNLPKNRQEEIVWRAFLGNIIAILPFSYPQTGEEIILPILENGICRKATYIIEVIPLKYDDNFTPMPSLGLRPKSDPIAPPILSFMGTTYPAGNGFTATLLADFAPGYSVGEIIYNRNAQLIDKWLENKSNVHLIGISLGGAMVFHTLRHHHEIARVDAYSPPGLNKNNWENGIGSTCHVNIYCQPGDIVTNVGNWPTGDNVSLYTIIPHHKNLPNHPFSAHARIFTGCDRITIIKESPEEANQYLARSILTKIHNVLGPLLIFFPIKLITLLRNLILKIHNIAINIFKKSE
jgi:hypothetical protein